MPRDFNGCHFYGGVTVRDSELNRTTFRAAPIDLDNAQ